MGKDVNLCWEGPYPTKIKTQKDGGKLPIINILLWGGRGRIAGQYINFENLRYIATMEAARLT